MTVGEFCRTKTQAKELCVIRQDGWIVAEEEVKSDEWGTLDVVTEHGDPVSVPCHYIDC